MLSSPEQNIKLVGNKWIFGVKQNFDGSINKYKDRLVAKGRLSGNIQPCSKGSNCKDCIESCYYE